MENKTRSKTKILTLLTNKVYFSSLLIGGLFLTFSIFLTYYVNIFNDSYVYASVGDLLLDKIPTYNLKFLFEWGFYTVIASIIFYIIIFKEEKIPFALNTFALLICVRCGFIILTEIGPPNGFFNDIATVNNNPFRKMFFKNDLFFSGHASIPYLAYLLFKKTKFALFMLFMTFIMSATVLLMHVHYSIDVFAAFFITYGLFSFTSKIFKNLNSKFKTIIIQNLEQTTIRKKGILKKTTRNKINISQ